MKRREFITLIGGAAVAWPLAARTQQPAKIPRIGFLLTGWPQSAERFAPIERFPNLAAELVRLNVDLIVAANTPAVIAARQATATIPIVGVAMGDPV